MPETRVWSLGQKDALEESLATHSRILSRSIPWAEKPVRLRVRGLRVRYNWAHMHTCSGFFLQVSVTLSDFRLRGDQVSFLSHHTLGWLSTLAVSSHSCGIKPAESFHKSRSSRNPLRAPHHHCFIVVGVSGVPTWCFSLFPSFCLSWSSTWRPTAWVCHEVKFITGEKCPPVKQGCSTSHDYRQRKETLGSTSWVCY